MRTCGESRKGITKALRNLTILTVASLPSWVLPSYATSAPPESKTTPGKLALEEVRLRETWRTSLKQVRLPKKGCFVAAYPNKEWREVPPVKAPPYPMLPRRAPRALVVGNGNDVSAQAPSGLISTALGSFDSVTGVTSESGQINATGPAVPNAYSLQLNTNTFASSSCSGSTGGACQGWQQFVYVNDGTSGYVFIQYWLLKYNNTCPAGEGWTQFSFPGSTDIYCYKNSTNASSVPNQPITNLPHLSLGGTVSATGDSYFFSTGESVYSGSGDNAVNAAAGWNTAEFCVVGDAGGGQANFNSGSSAVTRTKIVYGGESPPNCVAQGFTGETNNLTFGPAAPPASAPGPAVIFTESSAGGATSNCAAATAVGDTHLTTFSGLLYDFQATGDFILAQVDPDFVVQTRQVSGPQWPNVSVNSAVATRMGKTTVALCLASSRVFVNGKTTDLGDGKSLSTPDGVEISRRGDMYFITSQSGDSVRATVNPTWIDVSVGIGHSPAKVSGLLANANGNVNQIAARNGAVLNNPFSAADLYGRYADSWRVPPAESLLFACGGGGGNIVNGKPIRRFLARDLDPDVFKRAKAVSKAAGVKEGPLLDAATLDVAVLGNEKAAQAFVYAQPPVAVGTLK
jgi:von Willebrand factor type D domain